MSFIHISEYTIQLISSSGRRRPGLSFAIIIVLGLLVFTQTTNIFTTVRAHIANKLGQTRFNFNNIIVQLSKFNASMKADEMLPEVGSIILASVAQRAAKVRMKLTVPLLKVSRKENLVLVIPSASVALVQSL